MNTDTPKMPLAVISNGRDFDAFDDDEIKQSLATHGAIFFHGFPADLDSVHTFASRFNQAFLTSPFDDRASVASETADFQTVTIGKGALSLHFEYGNSPLRPDLLWFFCRTPPGEGRGGETLVTDGMLIFDQLDPATQKLLLNNRVKYTNYLPLDAFNAIVEGPAVKAILGEQPLEALTAGTNCRVASKTDERIVMEYVAPSVRTTPEGRPYLCQAMFTEAYKRPDDPMAATSFSSLVTWEDDSEIDEQIIQQLKSVAHSSVRGIRWHAGDLVMIDNNRVLHGRRATNDPARDIVLLCSFSSQYALNGGGGTDSVQSATASAV